MKLLNINATEDYRMKTLCSILFFLFLVPGQSSFAEENDLFQNMTAKQSHTFTNNFSLGVRACNSGIICSNPYANIFDIRNEQKYSFAPSDTTGKHSLFVPKGNSSSKVIVLSVGQNWEFAIGKVGLKNSFQEHFSGRTIGLQFNMETPH